ncbi:MAG: hypothetical protein ABEN55_01325 [Bradymonadaceae bacterium]
MGGRSTDRRLAVVLTVEFSIGVAIMTGVPPADAGTSTETAKSSQVAPPRQGGMRSVSMRMRPVVPLDVLGVGVMGEAAFEWVFEAPLLLEIQAEPLGFGVGRQPAVTALGGDVSLSYDTSLVRVGLGVGASGIATPRRAFGDDAPLSKFGGTAIQVVRIGARDGLHAKVHNSFITFDGSIEWGDIYGSIQVPLHALVDDLWVIGSGVHQRAGQSWGEIGVRVQTSGDGGPGSTFLEVTGGFGGIWGSETAACSSESSFGDGEHGPCTREVLYLGPMVGLGFEHRF